MMMNIGAMPGGPHPHPHHPHPHHPHAHFHDDDDGFDGPFMMGGPPGMLGPFANIFQLFGAPPGGVAGDAVYTQEALDRIMTQLMEQHQAGNAPGPASEQAIESLPKRIITKEDQGESGKAECSICMDEVELGGTVTVLPCSHWFHFECVKAWLSEHDTCPHCRQGIMPKEGEGNASNIPRSPSQAPLNDMNSPQATRPAGMPGAFPFPRQNSGGSVRGSGTPQSPFVVPDSPQTSRRRSSTGEQRRTSSGGGLFSRMRDTFGRGSSSGNGGEGRSG
jgi:E3 ubiquitin-protein ligase RNF115/126